MSTLKGEFIGFSIDGIQSSELGIIRTSNGSRFDENLLPTFQDKTVQVPGGDGTYYFGTYFTQRPKPISIAYDHLTESQKNRLVQLLSDRKIHKLVFNEAPQKTFLVRVNGTPNLKFVPFDEYYYQVNGGGTSELSVRRIYKGEGTLGFVSYKPFAQSTFKFLDQYSEDTHTTVSEVVWDGGNASGTWD